MDTTQAEKALERQLQEVTTRLYSAGRLGERLLSQKKQIEEQLEVLEGVNRIPENLKAKLQELEREFEEIKKESNDSWLLLGSLDEVSSLDQQIKPNIPQFISNGTISPIKHGFSTRRRSNKPISQPHDIEFATEIGQSLLAEVRRLQGLLNEREEQWKAIICEKGYLEHEMEGLEGKLKTLEESEEKYKEENWNLELMTQEMAKEISRLSALETRISQENARLLKITQTQIETIETLKQREMELTEILEQLRVKHESEITSYRKAQDELLEERYEWIRQVEELKAEREALFETNDYNKKDVEKEEEWIVNDEEMIYEVITPEQLSPQSPIKCTPSRNMPLEIETMKASFSHAQRAIHGLRNAVQREKTEKIELRRLLNEALEKLARLEKESAKYSKKKVFRKSQHSITMNPYKYKEITNEITIESDSEWKDEHDTSGITINTPDNVKRLEGSYYIEEKRDSIDIDDKISNHTKKTHLDNSDVSQDSDNEISENKSNRYLSSRGKNEFSFNSSRKIQPLFKELQMFNQNNYLETINIGTMTEEVSDIMKTRNFLFNLNTIITEKKPVSFDPNENVILQINDTNSLINNESNNLDTVPTTNLSKEINKIDTTENNNELQSRPFSFSSLVSVFKLKKKKSIQMPSIFATNKNSSNVNLNKLNYDDDLFKKPQLNSRLTDDIKQQEDKSNVIQNNGDFDIVQGNKKDYFSNFKMPLNDQEATLVTSSSKFSGNTTVQSLQIGSLKSQNKSEIMKKLNTSSSSRIESNEDKSHSFDKTTHVKKPSFEFLLHDPAIKKPNTSLSNSADKESTYGTITIFNSVLASKGSLANTNSKSSSSSFSSRNIENHQSQANGRKVSTNARPSIDPQIIRSITQTMIGEYLWKYTRKHARKELSRNRHLRFFWIHPYSRSLYWSKRNPSTSYGQESYAKSAFIESVRVVYDNNNYPQGIHNRSIVVITPTRAIKFTAGTSTSHELWYQALSYLTSQINPLAEISSNTVESIETKRCNLASRKTSDNLDPLFKQPRDSSSTLTTSSNKPPSDRKSYLQRHPSLPKLNQIIGSSINSYSSMRVKKSPSKDDLLSEESHLEEKYRRINSIIKQANLENVRSCCNGKHDVGTLSYRSRSFSSESRQSRSSSRGYCARLNTSINH
ncbi:hypothetical protein T552_03492 [Pneumocystis carinii B80]|uniref:PH domain-containing protein n=1 Tax=Pneumocystis carinii (strain B80) TaxID=1408658 RepID=A0A0W4ZB06_PNEC8|nr:hypothetical protein T552_03492 [Pneumocystis carinii B80]KTW25632.1 hypothetical protein T552_03492 [Pneumocystis carinii B80]